MATTDNWDHIDQETINRWLKEDRIEKDTFIKQMMGNWEQEPTTKWERDIEEAVAANAKIMADKIDKDIIQKVRQWAEIEVNAGAASSGSVFYEVPEESIPAGVITHDSASGELFVHNGNDWTTIAVDTNATISANNVGMTELTIGDDNVSIDMETGNITFGENYCFEEASDMFWTSMAQESPAALRKEVEHYKAQINELSDFIMENFDGKICGSAVETAIEVMKTIDPVREPKWENPDDAFARAMKVVE